MAIKEAKLDYIDKETREFLGKPFVLDEGNWGDVSTPEENMSVELLYAPDPEDWADKVFPVAFTTWDNQHEIDLDGFKDRSERVRLLVEFVRGRPISAVLESYVFCFRMRGLPRTMTHQIVRHRGMSFNQESFRVSPAHHQDVRIPEGLDEGDKFELKTHFDRARQLYLELIKSGVPTEQARNVLPMGTCTSITMTSNLKVLRDYVRARTSGITQDEHTLLVVKLLLCVKRELPLMYEWFLKTDKIEEVISVYEQHYGGDL